MSPTKYCNNCNWSGHEGNLESGTDFDWDIEFVHCPSCGSDDIWDEAPLKFSLIPTVIIGVILAAMIIAVALYF